MSDAWATVVASGRLNWVQRGKLWLAATHAAQLSVQAINELYAIAGASAVFASNEFDRCLRDARTAAQHVMTQFVNYEIAGQQALGLDVQNSNWAIDRVGGE